VSDLPPGYRDVPDEDRKKAQAFFEKGKKVADAAQWDFAISMFLDGLRIDPENTDAHQTLRDISLKRKASGGKGLGFMELMKLKKPNKDDKENLITAVRILAHDPGSTDNMVAVAQAAHKGGFYDTATWAARLAMQMNISNPKKPDFKTFIILKDIYKNLMLFEEAVEANQWATKLKPDDMDLQKEGKDLGAQLTMAKGKYMTGKSFRDSVRDMDKQHELMEKDSDIRTADGMLKQVLAAKAEYDAEPNEPGKLMKYVEALRKTEDPEQENVAIELLDSVYKRTGQFRWRKSAGEIKLAQLGRMERSLRAQYQANPADAEAKKTYAQFLQEKATEELQEYTLWSDNYPTETAYKYQMAVRLVQLKRHNDAIPLFQQVRQDPKLRIDSGIALGKAFMEAGFMDEAVDTLRDVIELHPIKGDAKSIDMTYYYARALEAKGDTPSALKAYSQVAQWNFNFRDVQQRIKSLRTTGGGAAQPPK
jgi:hypothetical protein